MIESLDELSYDLEEDGTLVRQQLDRAILTRGAWATLLFLYQELDRKSGAFGTPRIAVVRFRKAHGAYRKHSAFTMTSEADARNLVEVLERWRPKMAAEADAEESDA